MGSLAILEELHRADPTTDRLSLHGQRLESMDATALAFLKTHFSHLRHLNLSDNALSELPHDFGSHVPHVIALDLRGNSFSSIPQLSEALARCPSLQSLDISLRNKTDERVLRVMLPALKLLNGTPTNDTHRPQALSLDYQLDESNSCPPSSGSLGSAESPRIRWLDTPPSAPSSAISVRPVRSPQEKRELRIQYAAAAAAQNAKPQPKKNTSRHHPLPSPKRGQSVRPTENPATISDERTDWRKLLKKTATAAAIDAKATPHQTTAAAVAAEAPLLLNGFNREQPHTTRAFIAELKTIVRSFQKRTDASCRPVVSGKNADEQLVLEQLERKIDTLALQLNDLEKQPPRQRQSDGHPRSDSYVATASLTARWKLLEAGSSYAASKVSSLDKTLGAGLQRLLQTQTQVVEALLRHVNDAIHSQQKWETASVSHGKVAEQQKQQMKLLLDVAETLENDLEALQTKYQQEKTGREQAQAVNQSLHNECEELRKQMMARPMAMNPPPNDQGTRHSLQIPLAQTATAVVEPHRRIRKRKEDTGVTRDQKPTPVPATTASSSSPPKPLPSPAAKQVPSIVRSLTLKQAVDLIHCILCSKTKYDARLHAIGAPPETMEQHMYTYLNQRFGLQALTIEYAAAIWKACQLYTRQDNDVAMFHAMLRNQVDEDFAGIKKKLHDAVRELLRAYFHAKHPLKSEPVIQQLVDTRLHHGGLTYEDEWTELLTYLYDPSDSSILLRLVNRKADVFLSKQQQQTQQTQTHSTASPAPVVCLPFTVFEKLLYDYQLQGRLKLLDSFRELFSELDSDRVGVISQSQFRQLVTSLSPRKNGQDVHGMLMKIDPFDHDTITFSDAVRCLLPDIRQRNRSAKPQAATNTR